MFVLHVDSFKALATFAPRSRLVNLNLRKIHMKHIYDKHFDRTDVDDISLFYPRED